METPEFTYKGLLGLIKDSENHFKLLAFANFQLIMYLKEEHENPKDNVHYRLIETKGKTTTIALSGNELMKGIENQAAFCNISFEDLNLQIHQVFMESFIYRSLFIVYECIKNYNDQNNKEMIREMSKNDWFRMLRILRDHYSHFYNLGKTVEFPSVLPYKQLNEVSWRGITIKRGQLCKTINILIGYIFELLNCCYNVLNTKL